jgi:hypothetical protein
MPTAAPNLLNAPRVKASRGSVLIWVVQKLSRKDRVSFSITGPRNRTVRGRRQLSANKKTTRIWVNLSKLPKGTYQARWEVLWSGGSRQIGLPKTFRIK